MKAQLKRLLCQKFNHLDYKATWLNDFDLRIVINKSDKEIPLRFWKLFEKWIVFVGSEGDPEIEPLEKFILDYLESWNEK